MARFTCNHCFREFETGPQNQASETLCQGCAELGHAAVLAPSSDCEACRADPLPVQDQLRNFRRSPTQQADQAKRVRQSRQQRAAAEPAPLQPGDAAGSTSKDRLLSTLQGLSTIAHTPHGQKVAEDLLLAYVNDPAIAEAYRPFARGT